MRVTRRLWLSGALMLCACGQDPRLENGRAVFKANCKVCHAQGINGAPIVGNIVMWGPRLQQGQEVLVGHAISGFGLMPARAGKPGLGDEDIADAVWYMMSTVEN